MGGRGASDFTDSSLLLCKIPNVEEILFVGNGAGIGKNIRSKDIHIPKICERFEQVTKFIVSDDFISDSSDSMSEKIKKILSKWIIDEDIMIHTATHATVPFFYSETDIFLKELSKKSITIDMEMSVIYTIAKTHQKKCCGLLRIGDLPLQGEEVWKTTNLRRPHLNSRIKEIFMKSIFDFGLNL